jgi:hypothetical protein
MLSLPKNPSSLPAVRWPKFELPAENKASSTTSPSGEVDRPKGDPEGVSAQRE